MNGSAPSAWRARLRAGALSLHVVAACWLAWVASAQWVELTSVLLHRLGMARADAVIAAVMSGFVGLCGMLIWAFSRRSVWRTWLDIGVLALAATLALAVVGGPGGSA